MIGDEARCDLFGSEGTVDSRCGFGKVLYVSPALRVRGGQVVLFHTISIESVAREDPLARSPAATPAVKGRSSAASIINRADTSARVRMT